MNPAPVKTNRCSRLGNLALALSLGFTAGMPAATQASDTEIYLGIESLDEGIRPNVMFVVDTSGSMSSWVNGTGMDRLDNMKQALNQILDNATNVNVGLMRFHDPGGPVLFPVSYVDEDVSTVVNANASGVDVNARIDQVSDDAEEKTSDSTVDITSLSLDIVKLNNTSPDLGGDIEVPISDSRDDAEAYLDNGAVTLTGNNFGLAYDDGQDQLLGMRFDSVPIPPSATITEARIQFTAYESDSDTNMVWRIVGERSANAARFNTNAYNYWPGNRPWTWDVPAPAGFLDFTPPAWTAGNNYETANFNKIVQEIVDQATWAKDNAMAFYLYNPGFDGSNGKRRVAYTYDRDPNKAPVLRISYTTAAVAASTPQVVGLRFRNVDIPQGATINSARLEFRATADDAADAATVRIHAQASDDTATFTSAVGDITGPARPRTSAGTAVDWTVPTWSTADFQQTPDLKDMVQEVVNRSGWCGNNSMAFFISPIAADQGPRFADAFDANPTNAPILRVDYDEANVSSNACIRQVVKRSVSASSDDAEETVSSGAIATSSADLDVEDGFLTAVRFRDLPISSGQTVVSATLRFTADASNSDSASFSISGDSAGNSAPIQVINDNITERSETGTVSWTPTAWTSGEQYVSPDVSAIVRQVITSGNWVAGDAMTFFVRHVSGSTRRIETYDQNPLTSAVLEIVVDGPLQTGGRGVKTVRMLLKEAVDNLDHKGYTPIVDTLYEAANYFGGRNVHWGATRGHLRDGTYSPNPNDDGSNDDVRRNTRISHPASWTGSSITRDPSCTDENLNADICQGEKINGATAGTTPVSGATYISPITTECQANYIILLTDGQANHNHSADLIKGLTGDSSCIEGNDNENCGKNLVTWMKDTDQSSLSGDQRVITYTIGFNFSSDWLRDLATLGGGTFHTASTAAELADQITAIFTDILNRSTSFAAPSLSVNAFNRLFHRSDVYFSLFKPASGARWDGNVKKYKLCESAADGCELGEVLDANGNSAIARSASEGEVGRIRDDALSFWSASPDGAEIREGGAGHEIPVPTARNVYTYTGTGTPVNAPLSATANQVKDANGDGILDGLTGGDESDNRERTQVLLGDPELATNDQQRAELIEWIRTKDVDRLEEDLVLASQDRRYAFNDPLHSSPLALTFGGTNASPIIKLFVGTNDGAFRMINAHTGVEEWAFFAPETLVRQSRLRENPRIDHIYGIDGTPSAWVRDADGDGVIEPASSDFVRVFTGMRRGGSNLYAFDVTPSTALGPGTALTQTGDIGPELMWRIEASNPSFPRLGQTWSRPLLARMRFGVAGETTSTVRTVMVFGAGYDELYDSSYGSPAKGNAIYIVDPLDGSLLFSISGTAHSNGRELVVPGMDFPIPSDIAMLDNNSDGAVDRLYFGDLRGNVWRVDVAPDLTESSASLAPVAGKVASLSSTGDPEDMRRIFYPPDIARVPGGAKGVLMTHDLVLVTTGNRAHPLDETVQDRIYAIRDKMSDLTDADGNGLEDDSDYTVQGPSATSTGDLVDVTDMLDFDDTANLAALENGSGWYIDLEESGEKSLAGPVVLRGQLFVTTYLPEGVVDVTSCALSEGSGRLYGVNVLTGEPLRNWDDLNTSTTLRKGDRVYGLGGGIPSPPVSIFQEAGITLLIGGGGGATTLNIDEPITRLRTYWYQEEVD